MRYWVDLWDRKKDEKYGVTRYSDYFLQGLIPEYVLNMTLVSYVDEELGLCAACEELPYKCHVIEWETGRKFCPILFHDVVKPKWKISELV